MTSETLTLRPSMRTEAVWLGTSTLGFAAIFVPYLVWMVIQPTDPQSAQRTQRVVTLGAVLLVVTLVNAVVLLLARRNRQIFVDEAAVGEVSWTGRRTALPRESVGEVRRLAVRHKTTDAIPRLILTDKGGRRVLDLRPRAWLDGDIDKLCSSLGVTLVGSFDDIMTYQEFATKYPPAAAGSQQA